MATTVVGMTISIGCGGADDEWAGCEEEYRDRLDNAGTRYRPAFVEASLVLSVGPRARGSLEGKLA